ncbi:IclR family transcriptional regulator domain-containing protein [Spirosoma endbachense]|uniref:IclR family transcriptional regulator domain-containing protein n=1 Tax=Spirosoma endbachense TaxID=2666025 RepID=UPI001E481551|nr:IclR family transcriptional regulator C-terminal domain-containing protein [Spirosoma endbachense]
MHLVNSDQDLQVRSRTERNIYETASGRLLMAYMTEKERSSLIQSIGYLTPDIWAGANTADGIIAQMDKIRADALCNTRSKSHIIGLAVPMRRQQQVVASLSVFLPEIRFSQDRQQQIEFELRFTAEKISRRLSE